MQTSSPSTTKSAGRGRGRGRPLIPASNTGCIKGAGGIPGCGRGRGHRARPSHSTAVAGKVEDQLVLPNAVQIAERSSSEVKLR